MADSHVHRYLAGLEFALDPFQHEATDALDRGRSVLVSAPTGSGKTVVAEYAIAAARDRGMRAFYTTPIKALSNQKFGDLRRQHGPGRVGLLTGDNSVDGDAPVVVMTTEVLRNMIYAGRRLDDLAVVVLDEVHYLQDSFRGPVWEEVIIHLPEHVQLVCLSATVSNADDIGAWLETVRGPTTVVVEEQRPVELTNTYLVGDRTSPTPHLVDTLVDGHPNPEGNRFDRDESNGRRPAKGPRRRGPRRRWYTPDRIEVLDLLTGRELLPVIVFIFSRAACDDAVRQCLAGGIHLTSPPEARRIRHMATPYLDCLTPADRDALDVETWMAGLEAGIAAHHAGHVPPFKEAVEACFAAGLVKVVFATETLALGVNMPARAVVIERLTKFNGEERAPLTAGQYTQLTGRAGRRGLDEHGTAVVLWSPFVGFGTVAGLAASRSFALRSAFRPTYSMAANLIRRHDETESRRLLHLCLAQFQADRDVVVLERRLDGRRHVLAELEDEAHCELGDVEEYAALTAGTLPRAERRAMVREALVGLHPRHVIGTAEGPLVVLTVAERRNESVVVRALDPAGGMHHLGVGDFQDPPRRLGAVEIEAAYAPDDPDYRRALTVALQQMRLPQIRGGPAVDHPVAACPDADAHLRARRRASRVRSEIGGIEHQIGSRTTSLGQQFDRVLRVLEGFGHVESWTLTERGELLAGVSHEAELVVAEALSDGVFDGLVGAELAAVASSLVYEYRGPGQPPAASYPNPRVRAAIGAIEQLAARVQQAEERVGLPLSRRPDPGIAASVYAWCRGAGLAPVLDQPHVELTGGDFVRTARQLADLLRQLAQLAPARSTRTAARAAIRALERGVVSASIDLDRIDDGPEPAP